jgi:hypothetical protein
VAFRGEFLKDQDGIGINTFGANSLAPAPFGSGISSTQNHGDLGSLTATLNLHPTASLKIQPEIRYNKTTYAGGFEGKNNQVIIGVGASYLF